MHDLATKIVAKLFPGYDLATKNLYAKLYPKYGLEFDFHRKIIPWICLAKGMAWLLQHTANRNYKIQTYKWKVSLNFGDQLLLLDLVEVFAFLVAKVRTNQMHFYERSEHPIGSPLDVVSCDNYNQNVIIPLANWCRFNWNNNSRSSILEEAIV